jgi:gamma-glutamylcyclotransferase (GGCT)/AIG2-like uncharacterized protein YtfP
MPLYFAYGLNLDRAAMARRCPRSRALGPARLARHRFFITADGYASVRRDPRGTVHGLLWELALGDIPALDRFESLSTGLYQKIVQPVLTATGPRQALVYVGRSGQPGAPRPRYLEEVLAAARTLVLPPAYLAELEQWLPQAGRAPTRPGLRA